MATKKAAAVGYVFGNVDTISDVYPSVEEALKVAEEEACVGEDIDVYELVSVGRYTSKIVMEKI